MNLKVKLEEQEQRFDARFSEQDQHFNANMKSTVLLHGKDGATFTPSVSDDGVLSWENDRELPNPDPVNIKGEQGEDGATFTPSVSDDGVLSWENDRELPTPDPVNIKGDQGEDGATFIPSVSDDGVLSWENDRGLPNPDPVNIKGEPGADGHTPVLGKDYLTPADKAEMVQSVIAALPVYNGEVVSV